MRGYTIGGKGIKWVIIVGRLQVLRSCLLALRCKGNAFLANGQNYLQGGSEKMVAWWGRGWGKARGRWRGGVIVLLSSSYLVR